MLKRLKDNWEILILVFAFLLIKSLFLLKPHLINWDEAVYLGMGKYIWSWGKVGLWEEIRPWGLPFLLGFFWKSKLDYFLWAEVLINLLAAGSLILVYYIGKELKNKYSGLAATFLLAITPLFFSYSSLVLTSLTSTFFTLLAVYFYLLRKNFVWIGLLTAVSFMFRFQQGLLLIIFLLLIWSREKKKLFDLIKLLAGFSALFFLFLIVNYFLYASETSNLFHALFRTLLLAKSHQSNILNSQNTLFYIKNLFLNNYFLIFSLSGIFFVAKDIKKNKKWLVVLLSGFIYLFYFSSIVNKQMRFSLSFLPYFCLLSVFGFWEFYRRIHRRKIVKIFFLTGSCVLIIFSLAPILKENYRDYQWRSDQEERIIKIYQLPDFEGITLTGNPIPAAYLNRKFIPFYQDPLTASKIYSVWKNRAGHIIYFGQFYPCLDAGCVQSQQDLFDQIKEEKNLIYSDSSNNQDFYFFT